MIIYESITEANRSAANAYIADAWGTTLMVIRGKPVEVALHPGLCAKQNDAIVGIAMYTIGAHDAELLLLDCQMPGQGIGGALVERVAAIARDAGCRRLVLITTNDNLNALRFYQKRGFDMVALYRNATDRVRALKPNVPLLGDFGIPLRHEIELERLL